MHPCSLPSHTLINSFLWTVHASRVWDVQFALTLLFPHNSPPIHSQGYYTQVAKCTSSLGRPAEWGTFQVSQLDIECWVTLGQSLNLFGLPCSLLMKKNESFFFSFSLHGESRLENLRWQEVWLFARWMICVLLHACFHLHLPRAPILPSIYGPWVTGSWNSQGNKISLSSYMGWG